MKNLLLASVAVIALAATPVMAQEVKADADAGAVVGGTAGGATGAVVGGLIFGPIGAVIGGFTGATLGAAAGVEASSVEYVRLNPTEPVVIEGDVDVGFVVPETIEVHTIENDETYGYFYTEDRVYFVDLSNRTVVYSPGTVVAAEVSN
ncbi:MAG: DUF1236 domain-containing protein [Devosia sp.]|jgi:hypothetical protein|uniref:DUF1236 domain-containing protein n=1 Tax=Devosia sp. XGJD_8 TaxID=3391187 RepID=UPI001D2E2B89|nr:DUF1236 domain-containing protein [Alphaproteobacteria bacterium]MBU1561818.1 DUF1236 domain-containing protein [Alphaproteobacteria bacterium]MBU2304584.1 DUF1236 domain-containing protein [Alphaproteobacteria bacterium]MBU2368084.1 DUF1236 domain-containing protein [Alphaproteobacteria bacterium]